MKCGVKQHRPYRKMDQVGGLEVGNPQLGVDTPRRRHATST